MPNLYGHKQIKLKKFYPKESNDQEKVVNAIIRCQCNYCGKKCICRRNKQDCNKYCHNNTYM